MNESEGGKAEKTRANRTESSRAYEEAPVHAENGNATVLQEHANVASERETRKGRAF